MNDADPIKVLEDAHARDDWPTVFNAAPHLLRLVRAEEAEVQAYRRGCTFEALLNLQDATAKARYALAAAVKGSTT